MKKQQVRKIGDQLELGGICAQGAHDLGPGIGLVANTGAVMTAAVDAGTKANTDYHFAMDASLVATVALAVQMEKAGKFIMVVRDNLKPIFGTRYNEAWNKVGFYSRTLKVPVTMKLRASLLKAIEQFFETRPDLEIPNVMTSLMAGTLYTDFNAACGVSRRQSRAAREARSAQGGNGRIARPHPVLAC